MMKAFDIQRFAAVALLAAVGSVISVVAPAEFRPAGAALLILAAGALRSFLRGDDDESPPSPPVGGTPIVAATVALALLVVALTMAACGPSQRVGAYGAHLAACEDAANSCEEYVACRDRVELAAGRGHYLATCLPATVDAGAEGGAR